MELCRICLATGAATDIFQLQMDKNDNSKSYENIMLFCLDIQVEQSTKISTKLCTKCSKKLVAFHKFKTLALKNDEYFKSLDDIGVKNEVFIKDIVQIKTEPSINNNDIDLKEDMKEDFLIKLEREPEAYESDDEFLSVIKNEYIEEDANEVSVEKSKNSKQIYKKRKKKSPHSPTLMCEECGKIVKDLNAHMEIHMPLEKRQSFKCEFCDKTFRSRHSRYKHHRFKHMGVKNICPICNKVVTHLRQHHMAVHEPSLLPYVCVLCGQRCASKYSLEVHMTSHTKSRPVSCEVCDKKFSTKTLMTMHKRRVHDKEKSHLCQLCSKSFFKKYHLLAHLRSHSKEKPYKCSDCGKCFSSSTVLNSHMLIHAGDRKYACEHCDMTFVKLGYLKAHMISHTKEKRHACQYCGVRFGRSDHRKRHEFTAHLKHLMSCKTPDANAGTKTMENRVLLQRLDLNDRTQ